MKAKYFLILLSGFILLASCKRYLETAFKNPNAPVAVDPELVMPSVAANLARGLQFDSRGLGAYVQYWCRTSSGDIWDRMGYNPGSDFGGEKWRTHYWNLGQNLNNVIRDGKVVGKPDYVGVSYAIFAWSWLLLTDYHGDVILKQAFQTDRLTFDYDKQEEVYAMIPSLCDSAIKYLTIAQSLGTGNLANGDKYIYGGNLSRWIKFTHGVRAKLYHRYIMKSNYQPDSVIKYVDLSFANSSDDATIKFDNGTFSDGANFYGQRRNNLGTYRQTNYLIGLMNGTTFPGAFDPRLSYIFKSSGDGTFRGLNPNSGESTTLPTAQKTFNFFGTVSTTVPAVDTARTYFKNTSPFPILTYTELQFEKSEAAFKKGDKTLALAAYRSGILGSFDQLTTQYTGYKAITTADRDGYLNNASVSPTDPNSLTLRHIMLQKYVSLWPYGMEETWVDLRKYKYDTTVYRGFTPVASLYPDNGGKLAQRVRPRYNSEYLWNVESLKLIGATNLDYHTKPVWFSE